MSLEINSTNFLADPNLKFYARFESGALTTDSSGEGHTLTAFNSYSQDFNALNTADLNGQDSWSGGVEFDVQTSVVYEGAKAISALTAAAGQAYRNVPSLATGKLDIWMQKSNTAGGEVFTVLRAGANGRAYVKFNASGYIQVYNNDASPAYDNLQTYVKDTWYKITIVFDATAGTYNVLVDDVSRITGAKMLNTGAISRITLDTDGTGDTGYWDNIKYNEITEDASGKFAGAVALDGNDAFSATDHADFKPTGNFTMGAWVKVSSIADDAFCLISYSQNTKVAGWGLYVGWGGSSTVGYAKFISGNNTGTTRHTHYDTVVGTVDVVDGNWHFIVGTWDGSYLRVYTDGGDAQAQIWGNAPAYAATNYVRIGCNNLTGTNTQFLTGSLDDVFLLNGTALSADQIKAVYLGLNWTAINGLGIASIKEINGLAKESVKSFNGI